MRVLLVEDEPDIASGLLRALRNEGFSVDLAVDGEEGLRKAGTVAYDLIILDVMLPKIDGWQVLEKIREKQHTPVLVLTARDATQDRVRGLDGGADDYLTKPFDLPELISRVRALIRRSKRQSSPILEVGAVHIDTIARRVPATMRNSGKPSRLASAPPVACAISWSRCCTSPASRQARDSCSST